MHKMIFACFAAGNQDALQALLLAESIRTFAGEFSELPFWLMLPKEKERLSRQLILKVEQLQVELHSFEIDPRAASFPFAGKTIASAAAEIVSEGMCIQLVWMDHNALVVNPVDPLVLTSGVRFGYRPVDHLLVGSPFDKPLDPFWEFVYQVCGVNQADIFPMLTSTDQVQMRPYFNAGMLVVRPGDRLLRRWRDIFLEIYQDKHLLEFYDKNRLYKIFTHQAILAGCVLSSFRRQEMNELPYLVNYPLHMHTQYPPALQPSSLNQMVSFRYEGFFSKPGWQELIQVDPPLKDWLEEREKSLAWR
jgi:hypothetical protein